MAFAYKASDPLLRDFAAFVVTRVKAHERPLVDRCIELHGRYTWEPWAMIAANHTDAWVKARHEAGDTIPRRIAGSASTRAAGEVVAAMLNAGELSYVPGQAAQAALLAAGGENAAGYRK